MNTIWEVKPKANRGVMGMIKDRFLSFTMVLGIAFLLLVSLVVTAAVAAFTSWLPGGEAIGHVIDLAVSFGVVMLLFAMIFKLLPDVKIAWKDVWLGAAATAGLFVVGKFLIGLYLGKANVTSSYGAAGPVIVVLIWVYYSAQILFLGAEFTQVYANQYGSRVVPKDTAEQVTTQQREQEGLTDSHPNKAPAHTSVPVTAQPPESSPFKTIIGIIISLLLFRRKRTAEENRSS